MPEKKLAYIVPAALIFLGLFSSSCGRNGANEKIMSIYAKAAGTYAAGRFTESAELLSAAKNFPPALVMKGKAEFFSGNDVEAEKSLRGALKLNPASSDALIFLARLLREKGETAEAERILETVLANNPHDLRALRLAAAMSREKGPAGEAQAAAYLDRAVEASAEAAMVFLERARSRWQGGNSHGALEDLKRAEAVLPGASPMRQPVLNLESTIRKDLSVGENRGENLP